MRAKSSLFIPFAGYTALVMGSIGCGFTSSGSDDDGGDTVVSFDAALAPDADLTLVDGNTTACGNLPITIRDFKIDHPDFEVVPEEPAGLIAGLVKSTLTNGKPVLAANANAAGLITSAATFAQWYVDVEGVNERFEQELVLDETAPGIYVFDSDAYFPIDGLGFGNEDNPHNYHFTTEASASFKYRGGESFTFRGDDDVWVFVNGQLVFDIGGVHGPLEQTINFDDEAEDLGLVIGNTYSLEIFQAERHVTGSNFRIETSIDCFVVD